MLTMLKRNLQLYFHHWAGVFSSLLGALIAFGLYIIFIQKTMLDSFSFLENSKKILDFWVIGGTLAVTSITTTLTGAVRLVYDKQSHKMEDFLLTETSQWALQLGYYLSAALIGLMMQLFTCVVMVAYFVWNDQLQISPSLYLSLLLIMVLSSLLGAGLAMIGVQFIHSTEVSERWSIIIGTASGFLVGVYLPIGQLPDAAQTLMKWIPSAYAASAYRHLLIGKDLDGLLVQGRDLNEFLGVGLRLKEMTSLHQELLLMGLAILISLVMFAAIVWFQARKNKTQVQVL